MMYTVVGINERDILDYSCIYEATWVQYIEASSTAEAAQKAPEVTAKRRADFAKREVDPEDIEAEVVIAVFEGKHDDLYDYTTVCVEEAVKA